MDVSALKFNSSVSRSTHRKSSAKSAKSFSGALIGKATASMSLKMQKDSTLLSKFMQNLIFVSHHEGEVLNALVTFFGTALIAPLFIFYNPFVKDDKDTRKYSAWRQPISAILALGTQVPINIAYGKYMKTLATKGELDVADLRAKPHEVVLRKEIKKANPGITDEQLRIQIADRQDAAFRTELERLRADRALNITDEMLINNGMISKEIRNGIKKDFKQTLSSVPFLKRDSFILKKAQSIAMRDTVIQTNKVAKILEKIVGRKGINTVDDAIEYATQLLEKCDQKYQIFEENPKSLKFKAVDKMIKLYNDVIENLKDIKNYEETKHMGAFESIKKNGRFSSDEILKNVRLRQYLSSKLSNAETALKHNIKYWNIVVSAITLPFACMLLNWVYPIAMEYIMPEAYQKKKAQQQDTLVQSKKEVKA